MTNTEELLNTIARLQRDRLAMLEALAMFRAWSDEDGDDDQLDRAMGACREALALAEA